MSEKGPEADIEPRHVNVAEVPTADILYAPNEDDERDVRALAVSAVLSIEGRQDLQCGLFVLLQRGRELSDERQDFINLVESGRAKVPIGKVFTIDEIVEAHRTMEENKVGGKIVMTT